MSAAKELQAKLADIGDKQIFFVGGAAVAAAVWFCQWLTGQLQRSP